MKNKINASIVILLLVLFALACGGNAGGDEMDKANKLIDESNAASAEADKLFEQTDAKNAEFLDALKNYPANRAAVQTLAKDDSALYDKTIAKTREAADKLDAAGKLDIDKDVKEYCSLKAQAYRKHAEQIEKSKEIPQFFLGAEAKGTAKDLDALDTKITEMDKATTAMQAEEDALNDKAEAIYNANPTKFNGGGESQKTSDKSKPKKKK
ncbi:MAG: hypothetical protein ACR2LT_00330 [Pyrinomonadaceae bacterium]